jgi:hypothetical protein
MIMKIVAAYGLQNDIYMLYFARLINKNIHPNIENLLNYYLVKTIFDLEAIIKSGNFIINKRIVKYILNYNLNAFASLLKTITIALLKCFMIRRLAMVIILLTPMLKILTLFLKTYL